MQAGRPAQPGGAGGDAANLYEYALFNEINVAVQNPNGAETHKTVLLQAHGGAALDVHLRRRIRGADGNAGERMPGPDRQRRQCTPTADRDQPAASAGALTRNNLFGREQSASIQGNYGLLEQKINLVYQNPHFLGRRNIGLHIHRRLCATART